MIGIAIVSLMLAGAQTQQSYEIEVHGQDAGQLYRYVNKTVTPIALPGGKPPKPGFVTITPWVNVYPSFYEWLQAGIDGDTAHTACKIVTIDSGDHEIEDLDIASVKVEDVRLPALDASSKQYGRVTVRFLPNPIGVSTPPGQPHHEPNGGNTMWRKSSFELKIDGVDCAKVSRIDALNYRVGKAGTLTVTMPRKDALAFEGWKGGQRHSGKLKIGGGLIELRFKDMGMSSMNGDDPANVGLTYGG